MKCGRLWNDFNSFFASNLFGKSILVGFLALFEKHLGRLRVWEAGPERLKEKRLGVDGALEKIGGIYILT